MKILKKNFSYLICFQLQECNQEKGPKAKCASVINHWNKNEKKKKKNLREKKKAGKDPMRFGLKMKRFSQNSTSKF